MREMTDAIWYFGYGSNMSRAIFCERRGMRPLATRWGWLEGWRLCFDLPIGPGERAVANVQPQAGARTCGVLYLLDPGELDRLDRSEGVPRGFYRRIPIEVVVGGEERVAAFTYQSSWTLAGRKPSARYLGSPARERFWRELEPLNAVHRAERFYGTVDLRLEAVTPS